MNASRISRVLTLFFSLLIVSNVGLAQTPANDECSTATAAIEGGNAYDLTNATVSAEAADNAGLCDATGPHE
ncbi:MAG: hypothetical protein CBC13_04505, partial [Planctomycetia bacterium TMED53]